MIPKIVNTPRCRSTDDARYAKGWQDANHAWQAWLDKNIPNWDTMTGIDLTTLPQPPSMGTKE